MLGTALKAQPLMYGLAMNDHLTRLLTSLGWSVYRVPFYFKVNRPGRFLREIRVLQKTSHRNRLWGGPSGNPNPEGRGVDMIVSNQSHAAWCIALQNAGFISGPSRFRLAASRELAELLDPLQTAMRHIHLNRGDGDGPVPL
jgi:hypothetical protein